LAKDPNAEAVLAKLAPGLIPIDLRGSAEDDELAASGGPTPSQVEQWTREMFPETRPGRTDVALTASSGASGRVGSDGHYARR